MIAVAHEEGSVWLVTIDGRTTTEHRIRVTPADLQRFSAGRPDVTPQALITASFRFLLDREPNTSILPAFALPDIARFFPAFETEIGRYLDETGRAER